METTSNPMDELFGLCDELIEGKLSPEGKERLETLVREQAELRRAYVEYMHDHAGLHWSVGTQGEMSVAVLEAAREKTMPMPKAQPPLVGWRTWIAIAASVVFAMYLTSIWNRQQDKTAKTFSPSELSFAALSEVKNAKWNSSHLPTEAGSRLTAGRLNLAEGLATILFDNGTRVTLEGPADVELVNPKRCVLHQGMLVARVSPQAIGFTVETATAKLIDHGTEFGVSAAASGETQVQVLEGIVDVQQLASGKTERLTTGKSSHVSATLLSVTDSQASEPQRVNVKSPAEEIAPGTITLTTAFGRGKDAYVQTEPAKNHGSDTLLLVKNVATSSYRRKAYLGFDVSTLPVGRIRDAKLVLTMEPSGYGYASLTPKTQFTVYGVTDQALDNWQEAAINWENAPANLTGGAEVDLNKATPLGTFEVPGGVVSGEFSISGSSLVKFLNEDTNGIVTFILVRDTKETKSFSLVHGFVSKRHPTGAPPTLRIAVD